MAIQNPHKNGRTILAGFCDGDYFKVVTNLPVGLILFWNVPEEIEKKLFPLTHFRLVSAMQPLVFLCCFLICSILGPRLVLGIVDYTQVLAWNVNYYNWQTINRCSHPVNLDLNVFFDLLPSNAGVRALWSVAMTFFFLTDNLYIFIPRKWQQCSRVFSFSDIWLVYCANERYLFFLFCS